MRKREKENADLCENLSRVRNLIYKLSFHFWMRMSVNARMWIDVDDLYQEAVLEIFRKYPFYNASKGAWTTYVHLIVSHRLGNVVKYYKRARRNNGVVVPVEAVDWEKIKHRGFLPADPVLSVMLKLRNV